MELQQRRVCVLTGASGRLGTAFCQTYRQHYNIVAVYRSQPPNVPSQLQEIVDPLDPHRQIAGDATSVLAVQADLTDPRSLAHIVEMTLARFGQVDLIVNAAACMLFGSLLHDEHTSAAVDQQFAVNVRAPLDLAVFVAKRFWAHRYRENQERNRSIINISSTSGLVVYPNIKQAIYSATKAALNYLTCHMAHEFQAVGVRVNALAPSSFPQIVPLDRVLAAIRTLDTGDMNGRILVLDQEGERLA